MDGLYPAVLEHAPDGVIVLDDAGRVLAFNRAAERMFACDADTVIGSDGQALLADVEQGASVRVAEGRFESRGVRCADGGSFPVELAVSCASVQGRTLRIVLVRDLTERKQAEDKLQQMARYDGLTALPNRRQFHDSLVRAIGLAGRSHGQVALMFLDLDRFKQINDTFGHDTGDELLRQVAARLKETIRGYDTVLRGGGEASPEAEPEAGSTVSRLGGDEFTIILKNVAGVDATAAVAERIVAAFAKPFNLGGKEVFSSTSVGIALYPRDGEDPEVLIKSADTAMYRAKELGRNNYQFFTQAMNEAAQQRLALERDLRDALERNEFLLFFQPKLNVATGRIYGVETFLRWRHPTRGLVTPYDFVHVLEEIGLIAPVGRWVLRAACEQIRRWRDAGLPRLQASVNISVRQFVREDLSGDVAEVLEETGIDPQLLDLELTEGLLVEDVETSLRLLGQLRAMGVEVSVDDFGTGYSSLSYLTQFPINALKIDQSFVRDIAPATEGAAVVRAIIGLARSLDLKVIAEGVETESELAYLRRLGCDGIQGYLLGAPMPADEFERWLSVHGEQALAASGPVSG